MDKAGSGLSGVDLDVLFRSCRFALRIPDGTATEPDQNKWTVNDIVNTLPSRKHLYHGEKAQAYLVTTIPNYEQLRHSLASSMKRTEAPELAQNELAISASEAEHFFNTLMFCVVAYEAKVTPSAGSNLPMSHASTPSSTGGPSTQMPERRSLVSPHLLRQETGNRAGFDPAQTHRTVTFNGTPSYMVRVAHDKGGVDRRYMGKLGGGAWHCVYPFAIEASIPSDMPELPAESALSFEIRAACEEVDDMFLVNYGDEPIDHNKFNDRSVHLEELAMRVASGIFTISHDSDSKKQDGHRTPAAPITFDAVSKSLKATPVLPRRMLQALVSTRSIADISTRVVDLPSSFGSSTVLVEVSVKCEAAAGHELMLRSVDVVSTKWHATPVGPQSSLPVSLGTDLCWRSVFRLCPLAKSIAEDALHGLSLLNMQSTARTNATTQSGTNAPSTFVSVNVISTAEKAEPQTLKAVQQINLSPLAADGTDEARGSTSLDDIAPISNTGATPHPVVRRSRLSGAFGRSSPASFEPLSTTRGGISNSIAHMKTISLDSAANSRRDPSRKLSLLSPPPAQQLVDPSLPAPRSSKRPVSMLRLPPRHDRASSIQYPGQLTSPAGSRYLPQNPGGRNVNMDQRARSATVNVFSLMSPTSPTHAQPRTSASTLLHFAESSSKPLPHVPALSGVEESPTYSEMHRLSTQQIPMAPAEPQPSCSAIGTISLSFEAPPKVGLGEEFLVRVHVTNSTNIHYFRLTLVDTSSKESEEEPSDSLPSLGLLSLEHSTELAPLRPGESASVALRYIAAEPHFHTVRLLRLLNMDADTADKTVATIESPFVVYVDDS
ncbi:hypothetical protein GQ54DRAFT_304687 [Martensiomyces pterosporus]|nr:hypothetical protein GQ54DRAFT_304687 [Martensiomyces pterosporus]